MLGFNVQSGTVPNAQKAREVRNERGRASSSPVLRHPFVTFADVQFSPGTVIRFDSVYRSPTSDTRETTSSSVTTSTASTRHSESGVSYPLNAFLISLFAIGATIGLLTISLVQLPPTKPFIVPVQFAVSYAIGFGSWLRLLLSMNRVNLTPASILCSNVDGLRHVRLISFAIYCVSPLCYVAATLAIIRGNMWLQFVSSMLGSILGWAAFIVVFNTGFHAPSRTQIGALVQIVLLSFLWELRSYVTSLHFV